MIQGEGDRLKRGETKKSVEETKIFKKGAAGSRNMCLEMVVVGWGGGLEPPYELWYIHYTITHTSYTYIHMLYIIDIYIIYLVYSIN